MAVLVASCANKSNENTIIVNTDATPQLTTVEDSISWAMGFSMAQSIAATGFNPNREILFEAICATLDIKPQALNEEQTMNFLSELNEAAAYNRMHQQQGELNEVRAREKAYFDDLVAKNPNVRKDESGIYYEVIKEGSGHRGEVGNVAVFDYKGMMTNGQVVDQTYGVRKPITHVIGEPMMPGLIIGMCLMREGSIYRFHIPSELAFGNSSNSGFPPNSIVVYEVEMHSITK